LAKYYSRHPDEFLVLRLSEVSQHMKWTDRLLEAVEKKRPASE
jgi:hypothetical protein